MGLQADWDLWHAAHALRRAGSLQDRGAFQRWAFLGGTALRVLYGLPRFSEDLDFSLISAGREPGFREALLDVRPFLEHARDMQLVSRDALERLL